MLDYVQALLELDKCKTMGKAATALRVSQSAISKRVAKLESEVGYKLIAKSGRQVVLTRRGKRLVYELQPIMNQLRSILNDIDSDAEDGQRLKKRLRFQSLCLVPGYQNYWHTKTSRILILLFMHTGVPWC